MKMLRDEIFISLVGLIMYVSTVMLETAAPVRDVSSVPFLPLAQNALPPYYRDDLRTLICNLMEILNE